jgi:hypothetical protein
MSGVSSAGLFAKPDKAKFQAIAACTKDGKPTYEQLRMNGMFNGR